LFSVFDVIEEKLPVWDVFVFVFLIYIPIFRKIYMALSVAEVLNLVVVVITAVIAFVTYRVAVKSHETSKEAIKLARLQLNYELCLKLYELKDMSNQNEGGVLVSKFIAEEFSDYHKTLLYSVKDSARVLINNERLAKELVNLCGFFLNDSKTSMELTIDSEKIAYIPSQYRCYAKDKNRQGSFYRALHDECDALISAAISELKPV